jgi:hypothetical protein
MKLFFSEFPPSYQKYYFPYQVYLIKEKGDDIASLYENGFLPSRIREDLYYLARGLRINLQEFVLSSENRRILRKTDYLSMYTSTAADFNYDYRIAKLGKDFFDSKFGKGTMSAYKIKWLFTSGAYSHVFVYQDKAKENTIGYCVGMMLSGILHYAYPFYDTSYTDQNMGMGMMLRAIITAQQQGLKYAYLGTVYTEASLYKTQFKGCEYFTGFGWNSDVDELKQLIRSSSNGHVLERVSDKEEIFAAKGISF